jgi:predicted exporter
MSEQPMNDYLFGPLGKNYCLYFYVIAFISFLSMIFIIGSGIIGLLSAKKMDMKVIVPMIAAIVWNFLLYIQSRLLYNMCYNSEEGIRNKSH